MALAFTVTDENPPGEMLLVWPGCSVTAVLDAGYVTVKEVETGVSD